MPRTASTFAGLERAGGSPIELYTFQRGTSVWRYTSAKTSQTVSGLTYTPARIKRQAIEQKNDTPGIQVVVEVPIVLDAIQNLLLETSEPALLSIQRVQSSGSPVFPTQLAKIISFKLSGDTAELTCATVEHEFKTPIPRVLVQRTCPWALYTASCGVDKSAFETSTTISAVSGQVITVTALADTTTGYYNNGVILLDSGRNLFIVKHDNTLDLTVWATIPSDAIVGANVKVYPGCNKTFSDCETKFANAANYGGFPNLPDRNPAIGGMH